MVQGEGCEQGDPLMPLLFSFGQHRALVAVQAQLKEGEMLFVFLNDITSRHCVRRLASTSTRARRSCGTRQASSHQ